jgi:hypothetical protein
VKDKNDDLFAESHYILNTWKSYISQLLNVVYSVSDDRQIDIHTAEPLVPDPSPFDGELAIAKMKRQKLPGSDQIPVELIQAGGETLQHVIHKLINSIWNKKELPHQWKEAIIVPVHKKGDKTECSNYRGILLLSTSDRKSTRLNSSHPL